jgi:protein CpxP
MLMAKNLHFWTRPAVVSLHFFTLQNKKHQTKIAEKASKDVTSESLHKILRGTKMSLKARLSSLITLALAFFAFAAIASAQDNSTTTPQPDSSQKQERHHGGWAKGDRDGGFRGERHGGGMFELQGLNLTDAQKAQIKTIHEANRPDEGTMQQMKTLMDAKRSGTITPDQTEQLKTLRKQQREKMESVHQQVLAILTPEQRQQLDQKREEMKKHWEERRQQRQQGTPSTDKPTSN